MASPSYTTDLTTIDLAESTTDWDESSNNAWDDGGGPDPEGDYYIQGDLCVSEILKTGVGSLIYDNTTHIEVPTDGAVLMWSIYLASNAMADESAGGMRAIIGSGYGDFYAWIMGGADTHPYGGWLCWPVNPTVTADYTVGTPTASQTHVGNAFNITGKVAKGNPHAIDAMRYGRCTAQFTNGSPGDGYATFDGFATQNDASANRWGLLQVVAGGYLWQGLMSLGTAATSVNFSDSNTSIFVNQNAKKITYEFNKIEIHNANSTVAWNAVSILSLCVSSPGGFEVVDNATITLDSCTFTDMGSFIFKSNTTVNDSIFRSCGIITQHGATFDTCTFDSLSGSQFMVSANDLSEFDNSEFIAPSPVIHAIRIDKPGTYTLTNVTFTGFGASGTSAATIYNNSASLITINLAGGTAPTIRNGTGASTDVVVSVTLTLTGLPASTEITIVASGGARTVLHNTENASGSDQYSYGAAQVGTVVDILCHNLAYDPSFGSIFNYTLGSGDATIPIQMVPDPNYYNP